MELNLNDELICPLTHAIPIDPVLGTDGQVYEKDAIINWLKINPISPMDRSPMRIETLKPCPAIKSFIQQMNNNTIKEDKSKEKPAVIKSININDICCIDCKPTAFSNKENKLVFTVKTNIHENPPTLPKDLQWSDICVLLDRSYSTWDIVQARDNEGNQMEGSYTINDTIRHAAKTILFSLKNTNNRVSFYLFDDKVTRIINFTLVNEENINTLVNEIDVIRPTSSTNIWASIRKAVDDLYNREDKTRNPAIILLTDGQPTGGGAYTEDVATEKLLDKIKINYPIYTFGFGYNLKRRILYDISRVSGGLNAHIPDGSFVATVFANALSNILNTSCIDFKIHITVSNKYISSLPLNNDYKYSRIEKPDNMVELVINMGSIQFEQQRAIVINFNQHYNEDNIPEPIPIAYTYSYRMGHDKIVTPPEIIENITNIENNDENLEFELLRDYACKQLLRIVRDRDRNVISSNRHINLLSYIKNNKLTDNNSMCLKDTWEDQVYLACISQDLTHEPYWRRWGWIYIDQLRSGLQNQCSQNFKDKVYNSFGGTLTTKTAEYISDIFDTIPNTSPTGNLSPSYRTYRTTQSQSLSTHTNINRSISEMNNADNSCFTGDSIIKIVNNEYKKIEDLMVGEYVYSGSIESKQYGVARVISIVKCKCAYGYTDIVALSNKCKVTPWHPVAKELIDGGWKFPKNLGIIQNIACNYVYSVVLENNYHFTIMDNDILGISLGGQISKDFIKNDKILQHPFYGTEAVIKSLENLSNYPNVCINSSMIIRDPNTNLVCDIR